MAEAIPEAIKQTYPPPNWFNREFLQRALREGLKNQDLAVVEYSIDNATNVGDNLLSRMYRVVTTVTKKEEEIQELHLIVKSMPEGKFAEKYINDMRFFVKEGMMMKQTLPLMNKLLVEARLPKISAACIYAQESPDQMMILEDLCEDGFRMADRLEGLDEDHCRFALEAIATFHAASLAAIEKDPEIKERHADQYWCMKNYNLFLDNVTEVFKVIFTWDLPHDLFVKLRRFQERGGLKKMIEACERNDEEFNVLTHGDAWTNNIMFKYREDGKPMAAKLVDFQISAWGNPVCDVIYFIMCSPKHDLRTTKINFFLNKYHEQLIRVCTALNVNYITLGDFRESFMERLPFGLLVGMMVYSFISAPTSDYRELNDFIEKQAAKAGPNLKLHSEKFKKGMMAMLIYFFENGMFD